MWVGYVLITYLEFGLIRLVCVCVCVCVFIVAIHAINIPYSFNLLVYYSRASHQHAHLFFEKCGPNRKLLRIGSERRATRERKRERERERERQRDRDTETQRHRDTERHTQTLPMRLLYSIFIFNNKPRPLLPLCFHLVSRSFRSTKRAGICFRLPSATRQALGH